MRDFLVKEHLVFYWCLLSNKAEYLVPPCDRSEREFQSAFRRTNHYRRQHSAQACRLL